MKMIWSGLKIKENCYVSVNQFHGNFRSKTPSCSLVVVRDGKFFRDGKWCFNASWGLKGLNKEAKTAIEALSTLTVKNPPNVFMFPFNYIKMNCYLIYFKNSQVLYIKLYAWKGGLLWILWGWGCPSCANKCLTVSFIKCIISLELVEWIVL